MKKINNKGFTMYELLAAILIMAILFVATIPVYSTIVTNSKRTIYADVALTYIRNAKAKIASKEIEKAYYENVTYYIDIKYLTDEVNAPSSPFGEWVEAYVIYTIDEKGNTNYYFLSLDEQGWMIKRKEEKKIGRSAVVKDDMYESVDIENIGSRDTIYMIDQDGVMYKTSEVKAKIKE